jgi:hypothetical protein
LHVNNDEALKQLNLSGLYVSKKKGNAIAIGGGSEQWPQLEQICKLAGGRMPLGYPPVAPETEEDET